jgi:hypothetical protein
MTRELTIIVLAIAVTTIAVLLAALFFLLVRDRRHRDQIHELRNEINKYQMLEEILKLREELKNEEKNSNS